MECKRWESEGLLFTSGELNKNSHESYNIHLKECESCRMEMNFYLEGRETFFTTENLSLIPSSIFDDKILQSMHGKIPAKTTLFIPSFNIFLKRGVLALLVLFLGVSAPLYFAMVKNNASQSIMAKTPFVSTPNSTVASNQIDSTIPNDSVDNLTPNRFNKIGNLELNGGVITVDLTKDK